MLFCKRADIFGKGAWFLPLPVGVGLSRNRIRVLKHPFLLVDKLNHDNSRKTFLKSSAASVTARTEHNATTGWACNGDSRGADLVATTSAICLRWNSESIRQPLSWSVNWLLEILARPDSCLHGKSSVEVQWAMMINCYSIYQKCIQNKYRDSSVFVPESHFVS